MDVIHFTRSAADPFKGFDSSGASFLPIGRTESDTKISCLHLDIGATVRNPPLTHAAALLVVHGRLTVRTKFPESRIELHAGMGAIIEKAEAYSLESEEGAIVLIVESQALTANARAISTPQRIAGATWPTAPSCTIRGPCSSSHLRVG